MSGSRLTGCYRRCACCTNAASRDTRVASHSCVSSSAGCVHAKSQIRSCGLRPRRGIRRSLTSRRSSSRGASSGRRSSCWAIRASSAPAAGCSRMRSYCASPRIGAFAFAPVGRTAPRPRTRPSDRSTICGGTTCTAAPSWVTPISPINMYFTVRF